MKYYSQYRNHDLFELQESLSGLSKSNRWVKLADNLPWDKIEIEYNKHLNNKSKGAGNKPARMVVGALIVKHVENLSDERTIQAIQENPYMQYLLGLSAFTEQPVFVPELFVSARKRLDTEFFNRLTLILAEADGSKPKKESTDKDGNDHGGTVKTDATCCDGEVRYPTDSNLLEDGSKLIDRLLDKFCARNKTKKPQTHRVEARQAFIALTKKKRKGKKLIDKTKLIQIRCLQADFLIFLDFLGKYSSNLLKCFNRRDCKCLHAAFKMYEQQKMMFEENVRTCADKIYLGAANRKFLKDSNIDCYNHPLGRPPKEENDVHAADKTRAIGERNEIEATFGTTKRVYRANDIRAKLDETADTWIGACYFSKNVMKFLRGLLCLIFAKITQKGSATRILDVYDRLVEILTMPRVCALGKN